jgi:DNA-binding transcriptional regulator YiaG
MSFATELKSAAGQLTAAQIAAATGASKRTVEGWRAGKKPPAAYRADLLTRIKRARARAERRK